MTGSSVRMGSEVYHNLRSVIKAKYGLHATLVGDEGGFVSNILDGKECLRLNQHWNGRMNFYKEVVQEFSNVFIEDPFDQDYWEAWTNFTAYTDNQIYLSLH
ncbi:enolase-like [Rhopalosiphum maidis]|uniref:enolase-like n=1 Tax=Rhopalosiphum maidis TaxID=43146 RepID=UPI000F004894|nr:enolase-like [Rhopalosiphum maidis]